MNFDHIINIVAQFYRINSQSIFGKERTKKLAEARQVVCFLAHQELGESYAKIGREINRDHTTVIHSYRAINQKIKDEKGFKEFIDQILILLRGGEYERNIISENINNIESNSYQKTKQPKNKETYEGNKLEAKFQRLLSGRLYRENSIRQRDILNKYKNGNTLQEIGDFYDLTRERIRQIVEKGILYEAVNLSKNGHVLDINNFFTQINKKHLENFKVKHGKVPKVKIEKKKKWSKYYDNCRKCSTATIKHASHGYCKWCYHKSDAFKKLQKASRLRNIEKRKLYVKKYYKIYMKRPEVIARIKERTDQKMYDGNREKALIRDDYKCRVCNMTRDESFKIYNTDLCVDHINETNDHNINNLVTRCRPCHNQFHTKLMRKGLKNKLIIQKS